jgi:ankyrin repeat protein
MQSRYFDAKANACAVADYGVTVLHFILDNEDCVDLEIVDLLLSAGADANATDNQRIIPIYLWGLGNRDPAVLLALVKAGADIGDLDEEGLALFAEFSQFNFYS